MLERMELQDTGCTLKKRLTSAECFNQAFTFYCSTQKMQQDNILSFFLKKENEHKRSILILNQHEYRSMAQWELR